MNYSDLDLMIGKSEYEERVRWLQSLYGSHAKSGQPGQVTRLANYLLFMLAGSLISLGERMKSRHHIPVSSSTMK
jgi:hypothetical protein